jgi:hypothetical protein
LRTGTSKYGCLLVHTTTLPILAALQELAAFPLELGSGDRSWLPPHNASRGPSDPRGDPRVFFSIALDYFPRADNNSPAPAATDPRFWRQVPGQVNLDLIAMATDSFALQRAFRTSADLALVATLVARSFPDAAATYRSAAVNILERPFLGELPIRPDFEWARAIPRLGDLTQTDWRMSHEGFLEMNGLVTLLDTVTLLNLPQTAQRRFSNWVRYAPHASLTFPVLCGVFS